jgi:gentisate 1,2-dioxygenase
MKEGKAEMNNPSVPASTLNLEGLREANLRPLWTAPVSEVTKGAQNQPLRRAVPTIWLYQKVRQSLMDAGASVTVEQAERRVLILVNPGHRSSEGASADSSVFLGLQLVLPGETTSRHRHSAGAARFVIEGSNASTVVNGEKFRMEPGDLILTPPHHWHEHLHEGAEPVIWLDILDIPVSAAVDAIYFEGGGRTPPGQMKDEARIFSVPGLVPFRSPICPPLRYSLMRYRWAEVRAALVELAAIAGRAEHVHLMYTNPETGEHVLEPYRFSVRMLRPGEEIAPQLSSASAIFHVIEGTGESHVGDSSMSWQQGDVMAAPSQIAVRHRNRSSTKPAFLLQVDNSPLQHKLGWYREFPQANTTSPT